MLEHLVHGIDRGIRSLSEIFYEPVGSIANWKLWTEMRWSRMTAALSRSYVLKGAQAGGLGRTPNIMKGLTENAGRFRAPATAFRWCLNGRSRSQ